MGTDCPGLYKQGQIRTPGGELPKQGQFRTPGGELFKQGWAGLGYKAEENEMLVQLILL